MFKDPRIARSVGNGYTERHIAQRSALIQHFTVVCLLRSLTLGTLTTLELGES